MVLVRRSLAALAIGLLAPMISGTAYAGGGVGGGGIGGGIGGGGIVLGVDHTGPQGHNYGYLDYFSRNVTVHQGDAVTWAWAKTSEPHTVTLLPSSLNVTEQSFGRVFPGAGGGADADDGAKAPPAVSPNTNMSASCGNSAYYPGTGPCAFTGTSIVNSGLQGSFLEQGAIQTYSVRVNAAPGVYHYICLIHGPGMGGTITVAGAGKPVDTQAEINARAAAQWEAGTKNALKYEAGVHPQKKVVAGHTTYIALNGGSYGRVAINEYMPRNIALKAGDSVMWTPGFHTVTFPASTTQVPFSLDCEKPGADGHFAGSLASCASLELGFIPADFPSGPPGRAYTGGFYNSGIMVIPKPRTFSAAFPQAGTYMYRCLVHPGMIGQVTVG